MSNTIELDEEKEEMEETVLGGGGGSVQCLLFTTVGWLVSHHSVLFCLLVLLQNLLIHPFLSLSDHAIFKSI